ncbi:hypothetical protein ACEPAF_6050 [Sanghuangporus sanghuang]
MQTAHIKQCNLHFAYLDSGAPISDDYTTLVCIHGNTYHAQTFQRLISLAPQHNFRLIALNRRDYIGSAPFNESELSILNSADESKHRQFLYDRGLEIAYFLLWIVNELEIPRIRFYGNKGGLALLGWSLGNVTSIAFLANLEKYPREVTRVLEPYLRHFCIYEAVYQFLGLPSPEGAYHPLWDDEISLERKPAVIDDWFTSYYNHPYFSHPPESSRRDFSALHPRFPPKQVKPSTNTNRTPEELAAMTDPNPVMRSEIAFYFVVRGSTLYEQYKAALTSSLKLTPTSPATPFLFPDFKISVVNGTRTVWNIIWTAWEMQKDLERWKNEGMNVRPVNFITIEGANHFALWDEPEVLMKTLASCLA